MTKSRFRFHGGHIGSLFLAFFSIGGTVKLFIDPYTTKGEPVGSVYIFVLLIVWIVFLYSVYDLLRIPKILFENNTIVFKTIFSTRRIDFSEISSITLTGKKNIAATVSPEEISILNLSSGEKVYIRVECYRNSPEIRQILEKLKPGQDSQNNNLKTISNKESINKSDYKAEGLWTIKFSGNPLFNFNSILFFGFTFGLLFSTKDTIALHKERLAILILPIITFYLGLGFQLHYFILSNNYLIVKNHFWFWKKHTYKISELREAVFESPYKTSDSLRLITTSFKSKLYPAGSLRKRHWRELKRLLEEKKIMIRDEIGIT